MINQPQLLRDLRDIEHQLRHTRNRLAAYELLDEAELAQHTRDVVAGLERTQQTLTTRLQSHVSVNR